MADWHYTPTHLDAVDLTGAAFDSVEFDRVNGPAQTQVVQANLAVVVGLGDRFVSQQPEGKTWDVHIIAATRDESDKLTIAQTFSSERKLVWLRADDGDGVNYRVACTVISLDAVPQQPLHWIAHLDVPNTVWEKNTATTTTGDLNAMSGDSDTQAVTLAGDRKSRPVLTVAPQAVKGGDPSKDFAFVHRGYFLSRAPLPWNNYPLAVTDIAGSVVTGLDTVDLVRDNGTVGAVAEFGWSAGTDTGELKAGHGFANGAQFFYIDADAGPGDEEQIFATLTGNTLTDMVRGIGGTAPATAHLEDSVVNKSSMLANGDDIRVYVDGVEVERWIGRMRETDTRAWINADMPPITPLTLRDDITAGATELYVKEGVGALADRGVGEIGTELIGWRARDVKTAELSGLVRGLWLSGAAGAGHSADDAILVAHHRFVLAYGRYGLGAPPDPIERRPAIDLEQSNNGEWYYSDQASDPLTIFYDPTRPGRTAQLIPDFEVDSADENNAEPLLLDTSTTKAAWKDSAAEAGKLQVGRLTGRYPQGITAAAAAIVYDAQPRRFQRLRILGRDASGQALELLDLYDEDEGAVAAGTLTPTAILHELTLQGVRAGVLGEVSELGAGEYQLNTVGEHATQKFILDQDTAIAGFLLRLKRFDTDQTFSFSVQMLEWDETAPEGARVIWTSYALVSPLTGAELTTALVWYLFHTGLPASLFPAGTYSLQIIILTHSNGVLHVSTAGAAGRTKHNRTRVDTGTGDRDAAHIFTEGVLEFAVLHEHGGPIQPEVSALNEDDESNFDKLILDMDPDQLPKVHRPTAADNDAYHASGAWINDDTLDEIALDSFLAIGETLDIDTEHRSVLRKEGAWEEESYATIIPTNPVDWLPFDPLVGGGTNDLTYEDPDMADTDGSAVHRDAKV